MKDISEFSNPSAEYRGKPFWSWNCLLEREQLLKQIDIFSEMGMGGYFCHSRTGLETEYLGDEWFQHINACADKGELTGMETWLYDEDRWPSGTAGGMVTSDPRYRMKYIRMEILDGNQYVFNESTDVIAVFQVDLDGLTFTNKQRIVKNGDFSGKTVLQFTVEEMASSSFYNGYTYVNTLNQEATKRFIELTHEKYLQMCKGRMGTSIRGIFTDEPHRGSVMCGFCLNNREACFLTPYTDSLFEFYRSRYNQDLVSYLPELFLQKDGELLHPVKWKYIELLQQLFLNNYLKPLQDWCKGTGLQLTGHMLQEDSLAAQTCMIGSVMRAYEYMDIPGVDVLGEHNNNYWIVKQLQSVARQLGKKWMLSELYGCTGWQMSFENHKAVGNWQSLFGINIRCHHLSWVSMKGQAKRDYPASIAHQSAWYREYKVIEDYFARLQWFRMQGEPVCDLLYLSPLESLWSAIYPGYVDFLTTCDPVLQEVEELYQGTFHALCANHIDFDIGDEDIIWRHAKVEVTDGEPILKVGHAVYKKVLICGSLTLRSTTLKLLALFAAAGGQVIIRGKIPAYVDACPSDAVEQLPARVISMEEPALLEAVGSNPLIFITGDDGAPVRDVFTQINRQGNDLLCTMININRDKTYKNVTITVSACGYAELWDAQSGEVYTVVSGEAPVKFSYDFYPSRELLLVVTSENHEYPAYPSLEECGYYDIKGPFSYSLTEPNVCVLDFVNYRVNKGEWKMGQEILKADQQIRCQFNLPLRSGEMLQPWFTKEKEHKEICDLEMRFPFLLAEIPSALSLAVEGAEDFNITINGADGCLSSEGYWVDDCFQIFNIDPNCLRQGENYILLSCRFRDNINLEAVYLLGAFAVSLSGRQPTLSSLPEFLDAGNIVTQGFPFYGAGIRYNVPELPTIKHGQRLFIHMDGYQAACIKIHGSKGNRIISAQPYQVDITDIVGDGGIVLEYILTRRNTFGPLHQDPPRSNGYGPENFLTVGKHFLGDGYGILPEGMTDPVYFIVKSDSI